MDSASEDRALSGEVQKATNFLQNVRDLVSSVDVSLSHVVFKVENGDLDTTKGLSFLELKCHLMINYLMDLCVILSKKCRGDRLKGDFSIERLVENRTVLEKMRPIEQKLKYHIEKLVKVASGVVKSEDPLGFRANPKNLVSKLNNREVGEEEDEDGSKEELKKEGDDDEQKKPMFYVPPKLAAVHYDGDQGEDSKMKRRMENARKRALSSSIIRELRSEFYDGPDEIVDSSHTSRRKESNEAKHRRKYEEDNLIRLPMSKKEKMMENKRNMSSGLEGLTNFRDISILTAEDRGVEFKFPKKKPRMDKAKKFKGKKKFKKGIRK